MKVVLKITYDGTNFSGWQKQPGKRTIQKEIENAIEKVVGHPVEIFASGRTDAGVHALCQVAHFETEAKINLRTLAASINAFLPEDIRILSCAEVEENFDARFSCKKKTYIYKFYACRFELPLKLGRELRVNDYVDVSKMQEALKYLIGKHDFKSFVARKSGKTDFTREIYEAKINKKSDFEYEFEITGNGFLYNMVRIIFGTLLLIGYGKWPVSRFKEIIDGQKRELSGRTMPAYALYLKNVDYLGEID
ncbi:MAG: tRNA pseudouridine(38-40) synthase TruA [Clostridia bacterium]|nr:tRNA pseudouridine(38-40) synthase TruA [Clostridia bacterium]